MSLLQNDDDDKVVPLGVSLGYSPGSGRAILICDH